MIRTPTGLTAIMYPAHVSTNFVDVLDANRVAGRFFREEESPITNRFIDAT
jgi:hypothetical protein